MRTRLKPNQPITHYHVMSRAAQQKKWLEDKRFKQLFLDQITRYCKIYYVECLAYCIMGTHFHLCLSVEKPPFDLADIERRYNLSQEFAVNKRPFNPLLAQRYYDNFTDLSMFMWQLKWHFSCKHNEIMKTQGTFWDGRFKSLVIENSTYLINCMAYLELNAVRAGLVKTPEAFTFNSVHNIKEALAKGKPDPTPAVGRLADLPDGERGEAYLDLTRHLAKLVRAGESLKGAIPKFLTSWIGTKLIEEMLDDFQNKAPSNWKAQVYGSEGFTAEEALQASESGAGPKEKKNRTRRRSAKTARM